MHSRIHSGARTERMRDAANPHPPDPAAPSGEYRRGEDAEPMLHCPVCSRKLLARRCKLYCPQCGYYMSCADYV